MSKYDFPLDLSDSTSCGQIIKRVPVQSTVLEFGCADGRMTNYMKDKLQCKVYIIEIDESSYLKASQYAEDGICCDANKLEWVNKFKGLKFDRIIFADVLEHLINPKEVLDAAVTLLKNDGQILVSIPNIGHADIICSLLCNRFKYTDYGLLDNTHIRFWGRTDFIDFAQNAGLTVVEEDAIYARCNETEQAVFSKNLSNEIRTQIERFPYSEIYQFIFVLSKCDWVKANKVESISNIKLENKNLKRNCIKMYFDNGYGFSEQNASKFYIESGNIFSKKIKLPPNTTSIRFDPLESFGCIVWNIQAKTETQVLDVIYSNGLNIGKFIIFNTSDPQIYISNIPYGTQWVDINALIFHIEDSLCTNIYEQIKLFKIESERVVKEKTEELENKKTEISVLKGALSTMEVETSTVKNEISALTEGMIDFKKDISQAIENNQAMLGQISLMRENNVKLIDLMKLIQIERDKLDCDFAQFKTMHEETLMEKAEIEKTKEELETELKNKTAQLNGSWSELEFRRQQVADYRLAYETISNSTLWKLTAPIRFTLDTIKKMLKVILGRKITKAISICRNCGFKHMIREIRLYTYKSKQKEETIKQIHSSINNDKPFIPYTAEYQNNIDFSGRQTDVKVLAFYLPQFHTFPENDAWWGKGFTEWTNVKKSTPRFKGHYQPRVPHKDIGYYCLEDIEVIRKQAQLAKQHGIYGFCFYYYWFSGKRLMEKPVDILLEHPEIDIPFCLCWANENWTRRWDGQEKDVLIKQEYTDEDDARFICDMEKYLSDPRYIRVNGRPLIVVYNPGELPNSKKSILKWREVARTLGIGELEIWICLTWGRTATYLNIEDCVDAEIEFPPHCLGGEWMEIQNVERDGQDTIIYDYNIAVNYITNDWKVREQKKLPIHYTCMMAWDNAARRKDGWHAFYRFSLADFYQWISEAVKQSREKLPKEERFIFINAWNEWGEGTYLEPDEKYGYANINTVSKAIFDFPLDAEIDTKIINNSDSVIQRTEFEKNNKIRIAVQAHIYYTQLIDELVEQLNNIPYSFDLFLTTDSKSKESVILSTFKEKCKCNKVEVITVENRGRDVAPFLIQMAPEIDNYDYIGHFHTKKTVFTDYGDDWRHYLFNTLLGSEDYLKRLFALFENDKQLGIILPEIYTQVRDGSLWTGEHKNIEKLLSRIGCKISLPDKLIFPAGNMFWAKTKAIKSLFNLNLQTSDFPEESGQRYATLAHQIERSWVYVAKHSGYTYCTVLNNCNKSKFQ